MTPRILTPATTSKPPDLQAPEDWESTLARVTDEGERVVVTSDGRRIAALISLDDLELLERLIEAEEDRIDNEAADLALAEPGESIPWSQVKAELGLDSGPNRD